MKYVPRATSHKPQTAKTLPDGCKRPIEGFI